ncbi:MAG: GatB/YqeY domain-containing protein [Alphaproteobacteria bacterium]
MLRAQISDRLKVAMKARDTIAVSTLRLILAALKDRDIAARTEGHDAGVGDAEILAMLQTMIRQRHDSVAAYEKGGRQELADREAKEIAILQTFLPRQMDEAEMRQAIAVLIAEIGSDGLKDMGRTMTALRQTYAGQMDFGKASAIVRERLA